MPSDALRDSIRAGEPEPLPLPSIARPDLPARPLALGGIALSGVALCGTLGALTNAVSGAVSPLYFVTILGWRHVPDVWRAAIAQGIFEGLVMGLFLSLIFALVTGIITKVACTWWFGAKHLLGIGAGALVFWLLGGLAAMGLAALSPDFYRAVIIGVPDDFDAMLAYAFVGGSIWGLQLGGLVCVILGLVVLRANWRQASLPRERGE